MIDHPNSFLVHQCLQAVSSGDTQTLRALWAEDIVWHVEGASPWHGSFRGPDAIFDYLSELGEVGASGYQIDIEDVLIGDERVAIVLNVKAAYDGHSLDSNFILLARVGGRRVHEVVTVPVDAAEVAAFWQGLAVD